MVVQFQSGQANYQAELLLVPFCVPQTTKDQDQSLPKAKPNAKELAKHLLESLPELDALCPWLSIAPGLRDLSLEFGQSTILYGHPDLALSRVLLLCLGEASELTLDKLRTAFGEAFQEINKLGLKSVSLEVAALDLLPFGQKRLLEEAVFVATVVNQNERYFKKADEKHPNKLSTFNLAIEAEPDEVFQRAVQKGQNEGQALQLARYLANLPANHLSPELLAKKAKELADKYAFSCKILDENELRQEGCQAILAVGQGSARPPRLIILEYAPKGLEGEKPLVFIGKGICFDSGGISLKPSAKMELMKGDMAGAANVLAAMTVIAQEKVPHRVVGILAAAENLPSGTATRPGDVVYALNGESIEITNTDAEGRLVLADALCYAQKYYAPQAIIDLATLTGACAVALGDELGGLFCSQDALAEQILSIAKSCGEHLWRLPLWQPYAKKLKSEVADICHTGPREGGAINAALFLAHFVKDLPYAHLDIAGVDNQDKSTALCPKGATAFGLRTLIELGRGGLA